MVALLYMVPSLNHGMALRLYRGTMITCTSSDYFLQEGHADTDSVATAIDTYNGIAVSPLFTA